MTPRAALLVTAAAAAAVVLAHYAYYAWPPGADRRWAKYVGDGAALSVLSVLLAAHARAILGVGAPWLVFAGAWGAWDGFQQALCGSLRWGRAISGADLCIEAFGPWPYVLLSAGLLAWCIKTRKK